MTKSCPSTSFNALIKLRGQSPPSPTAPNHTPLRRDTGTALPLHFTVQFRYFETGGEEEGKHDRKGICMMRRIPVLWYEMSVKNTSPKYIGH